jgi:hypothetical protein
MLHGDEGITLARAVVRLPEANKFDKAELGKVASTPWDLHSPRDAEVVFKEKKEDEEDLMKDNKIALSRAVYIKPEDLTKFGLTRGCPKCDHQIAYGPGRTSKPHAGQGSWGSWPQRPRAERASLPQLSALIEQWPNWETSIAVIFPRGRSLKLCNINASQRWFQRFRLSLYHLTLLGQFENLHMSPGRRLLPLMMTGMSKLMSPRGPSPRFVG